MRVMEAPPARWRPALADLVWLLPVVTFFILRRYPQDLEQPIGLVLGIGVIVAAMKSPGRALVILCGLIVFDQIGFPILHWLGLSISAVKALGSWNEALLVAIAIAALHHAVKERHRFDALDRLALAYILFCVAYLALPGLLASGAEVRPYSVRLISFRTHISMMVLFVAARHIPLKEDTRRRFVRAVILAAIVIGIQSLYEFFNDDGWNKFVIDTLQLNRFKILTTGFRLPRPTDIRSVDLIAGREIVRVGSVAFDPIRICFFYLVPFGLALEWMNRRGASRFAMWGAILAGAGATLTFTRSAVIALIVTALAALRPGVGRIGDRRARLGLILIGAIVLVSPGLAGGTLGARVPPARSTAATTSSDAHIDRFNAGFALLFEHPTGLGLGAGPSVPLDYGWDTNPENSYLLIGNELGVIPMVIFIVLLVATVRRLGRAMRAGDDDPLAGGCASPASGSSSRACSCRCGPTSTPRSSSGVGPGSRSTSAAGTRLRRTCPVWSSPPRSRQRPRSRPRPRRS